MLLITTQSMASTTTRTYRPAKPSRFGRIAPIGKVALLWVALCASANAQTSCPAGSITQDFAFTGAQATYVVPTGANQIALQTLGAQGNAGAGAQGGTGALGGSATGTLASTPGQTLFVFVGGQGNVFNGGGAGGVLATGVFAGGNGGGASDVRAGSAAVGARVLVAGGGGGGGGHALNNAAISSGGAGGAGGGGNGGNGGNSVAGGGGGGGSPAVGGAAGIGCSFALGTPGNGITGAGGNSLDLSTVNAFKGGAGGGGGGGSTVGGGGGGGSAGTVMCTLNDTGAGGGGAGGTSAAFAGVSSFLSSNGVRSGNGTVRLCVPNTAQALTFNAQSSQNFVASGTFGISPLATSASPNAGNPITYASTTPAVCTVTGTTVTMVSTGVCTVTANQLGDTVYLTALEVSQNITINPSIQTLTFPAQSPTSQNFVASGTFPINPLATSASPNSGNPIVYSSLTTSVCTVAGTTVTIVAVGTCTLAANQAGNASFAAAAQVTRDVAIAQAAQTLTFPVQSPTSQTFLASGTFPINPLATSASPNSGNPIVYSSLTTSVCTVTGTTVTIVAVGTCTLAANQTGNANFSAAVQVTRDVTIGQAAQTLTFAAQSPASQTFVASGTFPINPLATSASPNSGNPIVYSSLTTSLCTVSGTTVTIVAVGTCTLAANQAGNANFAAAVQVTRDVTITPATQVISFPVSTQPTRKLIVGGTFALSPLPTGGASGNPVTLSAGPGGVCSISGSTVTMFAIGTCTITANQAGGGGFAAAAPVTQTIVFAFDEAAAIVPTLPQWLLALLAGILGVIGWRSIRSVSMTR